MSRERTDRRTTEGCRESEPILPCRRSKLRRYGSRLRRYGSRLRRYRVAILALAIAGSPAMADGTRDPDRPVFFRAPDARTAEAIREAIHSFGSPSPNIREKARDDLNDIGYWSVEPLLDAAKNEGQQHRSCSILVLGRLGDPRALPLLRETVKDESSPWPPVMAALMLGRMRDADDRTLAAFSDALGSRENEKRQVAIALSLARFARRKGPEAGALLDRILKAQGPNPAVHYAAILALGFFRDRVAEPKPDGTGLAPAKRFREWLGDTDEGTRLSAVVALALSRLDGLEEVFEGAFRDDGNPEVRRAALMALAKPRERPDEKTTGLLCRVLQNPKANQEERETAAFLLLLRRDPASFKALYDIANSNRDSDLAAAAVVALAGLGDPRSLEKVPALLAAKLGHPSSLVRTAAAVGATRLSAEKDLLVLRDAIAGRIQAGEPDAGAKACLKLALEEIGRILEDRKNAAAGKAVPARSAPNWTAAGGGDLFRRLGRTYRQALLDLANLRVAQVLDIESLFEYRPSGDPVPPGTGTGPVQGGSRLRLPHSVLFEPYDLAFEFQRRPFYTAEDDPDEARPPVPR